MTPRIPSPHPKFSLAEARNYSGDRLRCFEDRWERRRAKDIFDHLDGMLTFYNWVVHVAWAQPGFRDTRDIWGF